MKPLSYSQRVAAGFGVIALGVCGALPFRRTADLADVIPAGPAQPGLALSADVALQLPGSPATSDSAQAASAWEAAPPETENTERGNPSDGLSMVPLPSLPDQFQPLESGTTLASSHQGVISEPPQLPTQVKRARRHKIRDGDTLESLALRYLDDEGRSGEIYDANRSVLNDPSLLPIGAELTIPLGDGPAVAQTQPATSSDASELVPLPRRFGR